MEMKKTKKIENSRSYVWVLAMIVLLLGLLVGWGVQMKLGSSDLTSDDAQKTSAGLVVIGSAAVLIFCLVAAFKTRKFSRAFAIFSCLISLMVLGFAYFAYLLSGANVFVF